jgi:hypothetical protein
MARVATRESLQGVAVVRVIDVDGSLLGDMPTEHALRLAADRRVDLVEMGPRNDQPPLCELIDRWDATADERRKTYSAMIERERSEPGSRFPSRWRATWQPIAEILMNEWDPIGVCGVPEAIDEYDTYVQQVHAMLERGASAGAIESYLSDVRTNWMGLGKGDPVKQRAVAEKLLRWWSTRPQRVT